MNSGEGIGWPPQVSDIAAGFGRAVRHIRFVVLLRGCHLAKQSQKKVFEHRIIRSGSEAESQWSRGKIARSERNLERYHHTPNARKPHGRAANLASPRESIVRAPILPAQVAANGCFPRLGCRACLACPTQSRAGRCRRDGAAAHADSFGVKMRSVSRAPHSAGPRRSAKSWR